MLRFVLKSPPFMWGRLYILSGLLCVLFGSLLVVHAYGLVTHGKDARFVRFMRRYDRRPDAADRLPAHAQTVDRHGEPITVAESGSAFQHVLDDLALAAEGKPVALTLDARLQQRAEALMAGKQGAVVVLEPTTGRIRALVSAPHAASLNRALNGLYPPGSTFKVFMAAAALSAGYDPLFDCPAAGWRPSRSTPPIRDVEAAEHARKGKVWKGFGKLAMDTALIHSANTYFAQLGAGMGPQRFADAVQAARLRDAAVVLRSAVATLDSVGGGVPDGLNAAGLAPVAIGQGALQMTPLGVALLTAAVADDGVMLEPTLMPEAKPALRARPFTYAAATRVKKMMRRVVQAGTGRGCDVPGLEVCGKTGTAQNGVGKDHAWFTCFAPASRPALVVTVVVEQGGFGATAALPIARAILEEARDMGVFK